MPKVRIVTDSSAHFFDPDFPAKHQVTVVPLMYAWTTLLEVLPATEAPTETPITPPASEPVPTQASTSSASRPTAAG